uniref:G-patch domain-containing protein n=1 Tax=Angiostrongylus cantonensis TaxID=6313 RepID=A0A0K0DQR8_ANGCA
MAIVNIVAADDTLPDVHHHPIMSIFISKPLSQSHGVPHHVEEFALISYPHVVDMVNSQLASNEFDNDVNNNVPRSMSEESMGKRSIALGRSGFRPGKRTGKHNLAVAYVNFLHGKKTGSILRDSNDRRDFK